MFPALMHWADSSTATASLLRTPCSFTESFKDYILSLSQMCTYPESVQPWLMMLGFPGLNSTTLAS
jgi:hypothetical protein